jgi:dihydrofolate reductase
LRIVVLNHISLDGVMQGPGTPQEDTRDGFRYGGWAVPGNDEVMGRKLGGWMGREGGGLLLGRRSYEEMLRHWNEQGGPFKDALNAATKYVVSTNPRTTLGWPNSKLVSGDVPAAVAELKLGSSSADLVIMGSGRLIRSLLPLGLIDQYLLMIHPLVLGSGQRLFDHDDHLVKLRLVDSTVTSTGVILATYEPA